MGVILSYPWVKVFRDIPEIRILRQSELPLPIPWNQTSDYFYNVIMTSQKPCQHNNKLDCGETNGYNIIINVVERKIFMRICFGKVKNVLTC